MKVRQAFRGHRGWTNVWQCLVPSFVAWCVISLWGAGVHADGDTLTYEQHIRPIFRAHCFDCHGADDERKGDLDLRLVRRMLKGGDSGPAIAPHQPDESLLLKRLRSGEMPPGEKKVPAAEIDTIARWIAGGAATARPEPETIGPGLGVTPEERSFWSFQPIRRPEVPDMSSFPAASRVRTPIDALLWRASNEGRPGEAAGSPPPPDADRRTLIVRACFDLTGLPPTPEEMQRWMGDASDDWYDRLLTALLDSPHYGERWARHWLDVAGYSDSDGYTVADAERPWAWKYRDWVIRSFNRDKPFDVFVTEQLAGDELAGPQNGDLTADQIDLLTATGFLRMAADGTGSGADHAEARNQTVADTLKIVGTSLFGLSLQCAQCHDHRYDPIPQADYFSLRAVFEPALDWQSWKPPSARLVSLYTAADRQKAAEIETEAQAVAAEKAAKLAEYMKQALDQELSKYEEPLRTQLRTAYETTSDKLSPEQKKLLEMNPSVNITPGNLYQYIADSKPKLEEYDKRITAVRAKKPVEEFLQALVEPPGHLPETRLFYRGDHRQPKQTVGPGSLTVVAADGQRREFPLDDPALPTSGRRLALARWLTSRENPLLARVIANRVWMHHFGEGLVATPSDFGKLGVPPAHPELLDWLADELIAQGWSLKKLHRQIMSSTAYRIASERKSPGDEKLPHAAQPFARSPRRLEAEILRDRMLAASGQLDRTLFGPPLTIKEDETGQVIVDGPQVRRSLYIQARRSRPVGMLQAFDAPVMETNCETRASSTVATQSLMLLNGEFILDQAAKLAERVAKEGPPAGDRLREIAARIRKPRDGQWQYGFGAVDEATGRTRDFTSLDFWNGSRWQAGPELPDPVRGWVFLTATGGHPDVPERSTIRRWTATGDCTIAIEGSLTHHSADGDGVRGRVLSSRSGVSGEWKAHDNAASTQVPRIEVRAGDTIDFVTDCLGNFSSDSFNWAVRITVTVAGEPPRTIASDQRFQGPEESLDTIIARIVRCWHWTYCREPTEDELTLAADFVVQQIDTLAALPAAVPEGRTAYKQAMVNLCQALLSSNEFLYVE